MELRRSIVALVLLAAVLASVGAVAPLGSAVDGGGCGCCSDCGDGCAYPLAGLAGGLHSTTGDTPAGPRFDEPAVSSACGGCPPAVGSAPSHRLDAGAARAAARVERPARAGRSSDARPSRFSAERCSEISPRAPPCVLV